MGALTLVISIFLIGPIKKVAAACTANTANMGQVSGSFNIPVAGTYRIWSRIQPDSANAANNSYTLEIDDEICNITVGDATIPANTWSWVDYQNGTTSSKIDVTLTAGTHTFKAYGREPNVKLDRIVFSGVSSCIPSGTGGNCATAATSGTPKAGDVNGDGSVNIFDLSILLTNWNRTGMVRGQGDLDSNTVVNIFDLSVLLGRWGTTGALPSMSVGNQ